MIIDSGARYSTGKIDHDILLVLLPLFLSQYWGQRIALKPTQIGIFNPQPLSYCVAFFFFSSGVLKLTSGYLDPSQQAIAGWLKFYEVNYNFFGFFARRVLEQPNWILESLDWSAVIFECLIPLLIINSRYRRYGLAMVLSFHATVYLTFGIDFSQLILVYMALIVIRVPILFSKFTYSTFFLLIIFAITSKVFYGNIVISSPYFSSIIKPLIFWSTLITALVGIYYSSTIIEKSSLDSKQKIKSNLGYFTFLLIPLFITLVYTEPYPAVIGPGFRAGMSGNLKMEVFVDGKLSTASKALGVPMPFAQNLLFYLYPPPDGQGHEFIPPKTNPAVKLPTNLQVVWTKVAEE